MTAPTSGDVILECTGLSKSFGGFQAVRDVDLKVRRGSIHALIGPNGAGKTTLFNLLTRFLPASAGRITYEGTDITRTEPADVARLGMIRSFQVSAIFSRLTVLENVRIALQRPHGLATQFWKSSKSLAVLDAEAKDLLASVRLDDHLHSVAGELSYGRKRALEIATTLALRPKMILLDEPLAGMALADLGHISDLIVTAAHSCTVLMVEHNISVVSKISDTITVLDRGSVIASGPYAQVSAHPRVMEAYMGSDDE